MAPVEESQIDTFSERPEVRSRAKDLYKRTRLITGPGTGYDLREGAPGLPAICALLACEELNYPDVSEKIAQKSSSLAAKVFQATLNKVRTALAAKGTSRDSIAVEASNLRPHKVKRPTLTYQVIIADHKIGQQDIVSEWFKMVEKALRVHKDFRKTFSSRSVSNVSDSKSSEVKAAVAYWVIRVLKYQTKFNMHRADLLGRYHLHDTTFSLLVKFMDTACSECATQIATEREAYNENHRAKRSLSRLPSEDASNSMAASSSTGFPPRQSSISLHRPPSPTPSPVKRSRLQLSPSKSSLRSQTSTPVGKRKLDFVIPASDGRASSAAEDDESVDEMSPSKRQKRDSSVFASTTKHKTPGITSRSYDKFDVPMPLPPTALTPGPRRASAAGTSTAASLSRLTLEGAELFMDDDDDEVGLMLKETVQLPDDDGDVDMSDDLLAETGTPAQSEPESEGAEPEPLTPRRSTRVPTSTTRALQSSNADPTPRSKQSRKNPSGSRSAISTPKADKSPTKSTSKAKASQSTPKAARTGHSLEDILNGDDVSDEDEEDEDEDILPPPRRSRPVLLGYKQWESKAPRVERERRAGEKRVQGLMEKYGKHPFDWVRNRGSDRGAVAA